MKIHHIGIIVKDRKHIDKYKDLFSLEESHSEFVKEYDCECIFMKGDIPIEFIIANTGKLKDFNKGLGGIHHIAFEVENIEDLKKKMKEKGIDLLEKEAVKAGDILINFMSPLYLRGVTIEFVEKIKK